MTLNTNRNNTYAISFKDVWFSYNSVPVLKNVSFRIKHGDFLGVIGPNGGGKTTLLKLCLGLVKPKRGEVEIYGRSPSKMRKFVGYVPQNPNPNPNFPVSVLEVVLMGRLGQSRVGRKYSRHDIETARETLAHVGLSNLEKNPIEQLSGGQRQRVYLARALASEPKMLLLDEPTSGIDTRSQDTLFELLRELNKNMTIVFVTHDTIAISRYIKTVACVNQRVFLHEEGKITREMLDQTFQCPVDLIAHGLPHRVFDEHNNKGSKE